MTRAYYFTLSSLSVFGGASGFNNCHAQEYNQQLELCAFALFKGEHNVYSLVPNIAVCMYIYILIPSLAMTTMCIFLYSVNIGN